jgi:hypothetical protein
MRHLAAIVALLVACDSKSNRGKEPPPKPRPEPVAVVDPACAAKVKDFEPWITAIQLESASSEIDFGSIMQAIPRAAWPVDQEVDLVIITAKRIDAYDATEHNHVGSSLGQDSSQPKLVAELTRTHGIPPDPKERDAGPKDRLRIDVDKDATWGDVARVVEAATTAGYTELVFTFTAISPLTPPAGLPATMTDRQVVLDAEHELEALQDRCKPWSTALMTGGGADRGEHAKALGKAIAAGILACNCAVDLDKAKQVIWKAQRWHQAKPRVPVRVRLGGDVVIEQPAATRWSEAHAKLLAAVPEGSATPPAVKLVAK